MRICRCGRLVRLWIGNLSLAAFGICRHGVSTNFIFSVGEGGGRRLVFTLVLQASPTNNIEVAIGHDENGDGHLSIDETALAVGYDCDEWFVRSAANDSVTCFDAATSGAKVHSYSTAMQILCASSKGMGAPTQILGCQTH